MNSSQAQQEARRNSLRRDSQLLEHEQLHFDIAEVTVRKIAARFTEFKTACATPGGTDVIQEMVVQADRELQEEQQRYDRETAHGTNARAQHQWALKVRKALN
jgi:predicted secreted Zn-dependent protease